MQFHVKDLEIRPARFDVELEPGKIDYLEAQFRQTGPLRAAGQVELATASIGEIRVTGRLKVTMVGPCDRCLEEGETGVEVDFTLFYRPDSSEDFGPDTAIDEGEAEIGFYEGEALELEELLREQVMLAMPMQMLCRPDCKGICPVCGQNCNEASCDCETSMVDERWAALKQIQ